MHQLAKDAPLLAVNQLAAVIQFPVRKRMCDLIVGEKYKVTSLQTVVTDYGKRMVINYVDNDETFSTFLPPRILKPFEEDNKLMETLQAYIQASKLHIIYLGGKYNNFVFNVKI